MEQINGILTKEIGGSHSKNTSKSKAMLDKKSDESIEKIMTRVCVCLLIILLGYGIFSNIFTKHANKKEKEVEEYLASSIAQVSQIKSDVQNINDKAKQYNNAVQKINEASDKKTESYARKNAIPNLLTKIMYNVPKDVQLLSIKNTTEKGIEIEAQSKKYEQLGYFVAKIKNEGILSGVTSSAGEKKDEFVVITIKGNLDY